LAEVVGPKQLCGMSREEKRGKASSGMSSDI